MRFTVTLSRRVGRELALDLAADVFRIAIESYDAYDASRGSERAWLYGIATNQLRRHQRTEVRRLRATERLAASEVLAGDPLLQVNDRIDAFAVNERLCAAVADLDVDDRDLLILVAWEQLPHRVVAETLGIPAGTVRSRLHRIRKTLRHTMRTSPQPWEEFDNE